MKRPPVTKNEGNIFPCIPVVGIHASTMNHMKYFLISSVLIASICQTSRAQHNTPPTKPPCLPCFDAHSVSFNTDSIKCCDDTISFPDIADRIEVRRRNFHFYKSMLNVQPPSTLSGATISSFTFNTMGYDKKNFILDANVQSPIALGGKRWGLHTIHIIPQFVFRIFANDPNVPLHPDGDTSLPVRTPSAIPGIAYYFSPKQWWDPDRHWSKNEAEANRTAATKDTHVGDNRYLGLYLYHHSNGQDGIEIVNDSVNIYNGNFGENVVVEIIYGQQRTYIMNQQALLNKLNTNNQQRKQRIQERAERMERSERDKTPEVFIKSANSMQLNWRVSLEWHPYGLSSSTFRDMSAFGDYPSRSRMIPRTRLNGRASLHFIPMLVEYITGSDRWCLVSPAAHYERWRFMGSFSYALDPDYYRGTRISDLENVGYFDLNRRLNLSFAAYHVLKRSKYAAAFAEVGYMGSDPYNIYFNDSLWQIRFGLAFGFFDQPQDNDARQ